MGINSSRGCYIDKVIRVCLCKVAIFEQRSEQGKDKSLVTPSYCNWSPPNCHSLLNNLFHVTQGCFLQGKDQSDSSSTEEALLPVAQNSSSFTWLSSLLSLFLTPLCASYILIISTPHSSLNTSWPFMPLHKLLSFFCLYLKETSTSLSIKLHLNV